MTTMFDIKQLDSQALLNDLKLAYLSQTVAPLDGMWLCGMVPQATHFGFYSQGNLVGYYCLNDEGFVLQFYLDPAHQNQATEIFSLLFENSSSHVGNAKGAFVSTAEPQFLSYCLDHFHSFQVNTLMYQLASSDELSANQELSILGEALSSAQLDATVAFAHSAIGAPRELLNDYFTSLIDRQELFGSWAEGRLIATGECRGYDSYQTEYADVGMIVSVRERGKGIATKVLKDLVLIAKRKQLKAICSTEKSNTAAQKAIVRSGFVAQHRILKFINKVGSTNENC